MQLGCQFVGRPQILQDVVLFRPLLVKATSPQKYRSHAYRRLMSERDRRKEQISPRTIRGAATTPASLSYHIVRLGWPGREPEVWLLFRDTDEYLIGFRNGQAKWFQFSDLEVPENFNPRRLRLLSSHSGMSPGSTIDRKVGYTTFIDIYKRLIGFSGQNYGDPECEALHASTLIFSEASRFWSIRRRVSYNIDHEQNDTLTGLMWLKIHKWGEMSYYVLQCWEKLQGGQEEPPVSTTLSGLGVTCFTDVVGPPKGDLILIRYHEEFFRKKKNMRNITRTKQ